MQSAISGQRTCNVLPPCTACVRILHCSMYMEMRMRANFVHKLCTYGTVAGRLYVCRDVSHRSKNKWEISLFSGKIQVFKGPATIMRSHRNRIYSLTGENGKGNYAQNNALFDWTCQRTGEMRCNRQDPDTVYNIIQGGGLRARVRGKPWGLSWKWKWVVLTLVYVADRSGKQAVKGQSSR